MHDGAWAGVARTIARSCVLSDVAERPGRYALYRSCQDLARPRPRTACRAGVIYPKEAGIQSSAETLVAGCVVRALERNWRTAVLSDRWFSIGGRHKQNHQHLFERRREVGRRSVATSNFG